jgi:plasmid stabilization system protein ParE
VEQADHYTALLQAAAPEVADDPKKGKPVPRRSGAFSILVKWRWRRSTNGHFVVYKPTDYGAYIVRILHTAMDLPSNIERERRTFPNFLRSLAPPRL